MDILLRPARPEDDCAQIAELIWSEDPALMALEFQRYDQWAQILAAQWPTKGAANSYDTTVLAEVNGAVVGLLNGFPASEMDVRFAQSDALRGLSHLHDELAEAIDALFVPPPEDAFYVLDIAVEAAWQKTGVGAALMDHATQLAGGAPLSLHVSEANPAIGFYHRLGFEIAHRCHVAALQEHGLQAYFLMTRKMDQ